MQLSIEVIIKLLTDYYAYVYWCAAMCFIHLIGPERSNL